MAHRGNEVSEQTSISFYSQDGGNGIVAFRVIVLLFVCVSFPHYLNVEALLILLLPQA